MMRCYLFDIDGTIADLTHRLPHIQKDPKDWDAFFAACVDDTPIEPICQLLDALNVRHRIIFVSGRSSQVRQETVRWIKHHTSVVAPTLYMRNAGDYRPDYIVKGELLDQILEDGYKPILAFDDRKQVVDMWRQRGIPCAQVAEGEF